MNTTIRLIVLTLMVIAAWGTALLLRGTLSADSLPDWRLKEFPMVLDLDAPDGSVTSWRGEITEVDPEITQAVNADETIDRVYVDDAGNYVTLHVAAFKEYAFGVAHNPITCYSRQGWVQKDASDLDLDVVDNKGKKKIVSVKLASWEHKERGRGMIAYWYQLGDDLVFDRWSLGTVRRKWFGEPVKPPLMKILVYTKYTTSSDKELARLRLEKLCQDVFNWLNQPGRDWVPKEKPSK
ncbi:MAG: exosortase-associated EpsI family protein [Candidatus Nealsonbacteria bacterium]|nr:exosortase-associated EpsI family protein [Candidatus Nealsonbacteria bacterium]